MAEFFDDNKKALLQTVAQRIKDSGGIVDAAVRFGESSEYKDQGVGIYASDDCASGKLLMRVPFALCISPQRVISDPNLKQIFTDNPGLLQYPDEVLALGIMYAKQSSTLGSSAAAASAFAAAAESATSQSKNDTSRCCAWKEHVETMPETINTTVFWSEEELAELQGMTIFHLTKLMKQQILSDYSQIHLPLSQNYPHLLGEMSVKLYTWALAMVYSRSMEIVRQQTPSGDLVSKDSGAPDTGSLQVVRCIPPALDMANHLPTLSLSASQSRMQGAAQPQHVVEEKDNLFYDAESDSVCLALKTGALVEGEQCFVSYGVYCNAKLLYTYGFVHEDNPIHAIDLWTRVTNTSVFFEEKQKLLQSHALTRNQTYDFVGTIRDKYVSPALLATIRIIQIQDIPATTTIKPAAIIEESAVSGSKSESESESAPDSPKSELDFAENAFMGKMISVRNEAASYVALRNMLIARMKPEKAEEERLQLGEMLLSDTSTSDRRLCALMLRVEERDLLQETLVMVDEWLVELQEKGEAYQPPDSLERLAAVSTLTPTATAAATTAESTVDA